MNKFLKLICFFPLLILSQKKEEIGKNFIDVLFTQKRIDSAYGFFDVSVKSAISIKEFEMVAEQLRQQLGEYKKNISVKNYYDTYYYYSDFEKSKIDIQLNFNDNNKIVGFFFVPHKEFEKESINSLNIFSNNIEIKGTLLKPVNRDNKKLVIFIHGSGPQDRDESTGENKPFKDMAEFLFENGISSYRYDKRTYSNPETINNRSTVEEETINDVINIVNYFRNREDFKDYKIVLLGHSLGAYLIPKIAQKTTVSKYIFLAGNARPLQNLVIEQLEYINKLQPEKITINDIVEIKKKVEFLNSDKFNLNTESSELPLGLSAHYWKYLLDYKPLEIVKLIKAPLFFAQGGKDYQVREIDFKIWKNVLKDNKKVIFKLYPHLNHLFIENLNNPPSPKDYEIKGNVNSNFLNDLKNFIMDFQ
ncbi:alpha/beta hydrolase [Flavobacterium oreochromis]|uniref:Alpha/beta fold hydrolase n=1 Tax=Flavobacterium columnare TaxID=996 RepID=A0A246G7U2_9FLAO|nr:DUF3887 domain-containing protein [Flavobacterium oreochromis]OWP74658.1 hypothetical protein BWK62_13730 [Flavobacterium oreochromis]